MDLWSPHWLQSDSGSGRQSPVKRPTSIRHWQASSAGN